MSTTTNTNTNTTTTSELQQIAEEGYCSFFCYFTNSNKIGNVAKLTKWLEGHKEANLNEEANGYSALHFAAFGVFTQKKEVSFGSDSP